MLIFLSFLACRAVCGRFCLLPPTFTLGLVLSKELDRDLTLLELLPWEPLLFALFHAIGFVSLDLPLCPEFLATALPLEAAVEE